MGDLAGLTEEQLSPYPHKEHISNPTLFFFSLKTCISKIHLNVIR